MPHPNLGREENGKDDLSLGFCPASAEFMKEEIVELTLSLQRQTSAGKGSLRRIFPGAGHPHRLL
jgi:hypothetical protein